MVHSLVTKSCKIQFLRKDLYLFLIPRNFFYFYINPNILQLHNTHKSNPTKKKKKMEELLIKSEDKQTNDQDFTNIHLRLLDLSDIDDYMVWATDDKANQFSSWDPNTSKEVAMNYIADFIIPHPWFRAICIDDRPIGSISVTPNRGSDSRRGEIGYVLGSKYWGKGIATRAVKMAAAEIFFEWPHLERLEGLVDVGNIGSQKVLEKAGFQREGVLRKYVIQKGRARDAVVFSLLSTDPQVQLGFFD
ncbi:uncharacterized protein LOC131318210 [Rhododendron vialii]|uniref:uncharacterized protein LOC131318210 n=1 Tax=Rhododendron vialii TaxID=182163 RepID=UPI00265EB087|nr:uncharacterized protein LOC131318210 [Rhododendron vialii]